MWSLNSQLALFGISNSIVGRYSELMHMSEAHAGVLHRCDTATACRWALIPLQVAPRLQQHEQQPSIETCTAPRASRNIRSTYMMKWLEHPHSFRRHRGVTQASPRDTRHTYCSVFINHSKMSHPLCCSTAQHPTIPRGEYSGFSRTIALSGAALSLVGSASHLVALVRTARSIIQTCPCPRTTRSLGAYWSGRHIYLFALNATTLHQLSPFSRNFLTLNFQQGDYERTTAIRYEVIETTNQPKRATTGGSCWA